MVILNIKQVGVKQSIDYHETFSPTVRQDSLKILLVLAVQSYMEIHHIDFETAYLNSK
jgi:hypothetical protein